ncbi:hypothetical protein K456DRAFT_59701, partial [Colletotrichum gloeosporioides 23]
LLTALNGHLSLDRATSTPLASSILTPSTANTTIQATSNNADRDTLIAGVSRTKEPRRAAKSQRYRSNSSSSEDNIKPQKDNHKYYNCNKISHIAIWCPKPRRSGPKKVKKVKKAKR